MVARLWNNQLALVLLVHLFIIGQHHHCVSSSEHLDYETLELDEVEPDQRIGSRHVMKSELKAEGPNVKRGRNRAQGDMSKVTGVARLYPFCPKEADRRGAGYKKVFMAFHRVFDDMDDELRVRENQNGGWEKKHIDMMISDYDFDLSKPTLLYSPGFFEDTGDNWLRTIRYHYDKFHKTHENASYNLLFYDWSTYAFGPYGVSAATVPLVADKLAEFFEYLHDTHKYDLGKLHFISFSLSAHILGLAARRLAKRQRVGQITHVDPTGVCFHDKTAYGNTYQMRRDDAAFTLARHYNMYGLGSYKTLGSLDIFVNGGQHQPIVAPRITPRQGVYDSILGASVISHLRGTAHEMDNFRPDSDCHEVAYECSSYANFTAGLCGSCGEDERSCYLVSTLGNIELKRDVQKIGYRPATKMFLSTGLRKFCVYQYQVILDLKEAPSDRLKRLLNRRDFGLKIGQHVKVAPKKIQDDKVYQLLTLEARIRSFPSRISLSSSETLLKSIEKLEIRYMSNWLPEKRAKYSANYCPDKRALIKC